MKSLTNFENPSSITPFRKLVPAFLQPPVILNIVPKAGHEMYTKIINQGNI
jgi:hypothetical protein